jgi:SAM-dependent methyltransferase
MPVIRKTPEPYEDCYCGSGKKYKFCHASIDRAGADQKRELSQRLYIERWCKSSDHFRGQGCYAWMASHVAKRSPQRILDIGCGDGTGLLALKAVCGAHCRILSCDDNLLCLQAAHQQLNRCGLTAAVINRLTQSEAGKGFHRMAAQPGRLPATLESELTLIQADVLWDSEFRAYLASLPKFDAVTAWLIGTYDLKPECRNIGRPCAESEYRLKVQNTTYELANEILLPGGVLHIVDRTLSPRDDPEREAILIEAHREQAAVTSLEVSDFQFREYTEADQASGITMVAASGRDARAEPLAMVSILSIKR